MAADQAPGIQATPGRDAFISYASQDAAVANDIVDTLERNELRCWIAPRDVTPGAHYADAIMLAISSAKCVVPILSDSALLSKHVGKEIERASSKGRPIIALRTTAAPLPPAFEYFLSESQWIDVGVGGVTAAAAKLVDAIRSHSDSAAVIRPAGAPTAASHSKPRRFRRWMIPALVAVVALVFGYVMVDRFRLSMHAGSERPAATATLANALAAPTIPEKSIAVLPFTDMSERKDQEYFADGMAEDIIDLLVKIPELRVPARTSSFYFKGKTATIPEIAKSLGVAHILEGSVRTSGNMLRVTVQLIRVDNGYHLWSQTFDRKLNDIFRIQDEIASAVVTALKLSLLAGQSPRSAPTGNTEAYTLYLQARSFWEGGGQRADDRRAIEYQRRALKLDPGFAHAWAKLAIYIVGSASYYGIQLDRPAIEEARVAAAHALRLDPQLSDAHFASARIFNEVDWNWNAAEGELRQAIELDPGNAEALGNASDVASHLGKYDQAFQLLQRGIAADPLYAWLYNSLGFIRMDVGRLAEAEAAFRRAVELQPMATGLHGSLGLSLLERGKTQEALAEFQRETDDSFRQPALPLALDALGRRQEADQALGLAEKQFGDVQAYSISKVYARRNDLDQALAWLDRAYRQHDPKLPYLRADRQLSNLRHDARFHALLRKMQLPEYSRDQTASESSTP